MKRETKKSGKKPWTASPEPVRTPTKIPIDAEGERDQDGEATGARAPPERRKRDVPRPRGRQRGRRSPATSPRVMAPPSCPARSAIPRIGVSESRFRKPVWMSRARSVPAFIVANSAPWMNGTASRNATIEWVGKPGSKRLCLQPARVHCQQHHREDQRRDDVRRLARPFGRRSAAPAAYT